MSYSGGGGGILILRIYIPAGMRRQIVLPSSDSSNHRRASGISAYSSDNDFSNSKDVLLVSASEPTKRTAVLWFVSSYFAPCSFWAGPT